MWELLLKALFILVILLVLNAVYQFWTNRNRPGPWYSLPIIGDAILFATDSHRFWRNRHLKYGTYARGSFMGYELFLTTDPEDVKRIFDAEGKQVVGWSPKFIHSLEGESLPMVRGLKHTALRKELYTLFTSKAMRSYYPNMHFLIEKHVRSWLTQGPEVTFLPLLRNMAFAVIYGCMIDMSKVEDPTEIDLYETWIASFFSVPVDLPFSTLRKGLNARKRLKVGITKLLEQARKDYRIGKTKESTRPATVIEILFRIQNTLEQEGGSEGVLLSDEDISDNLLVFLLAGHETVLSGMTSMMMLLGKYPHLREKCREEVKRISPDGEELTHEQVRAMTFCNSLVKEVLRYHPPSDMAFREVLSPMKFGPYTVDPGTLILLHFPSIHAHAFSNPANFDPTRFDINSPEYNTVYAKDNRKGFVTFAGGTRSCIGMKFAFLEMQTLLAVLMKMNISWDLLPDQDLTVKQIALSVKVASGVRAKLYQIEGAK